MEEPVGLIIQPSPRVPFPRPPLQSSFSALLPVPGIQPLIKSPGQPRVKTFVPGDLVKKMAMCSLRYVVVDNVIFCQVVRLSSLSSVSHPILIKSLNDFLLAHVTPDVARQAGNETRGAEQAASTLF